MRFFLLIFLIFVLVTSACKSSRHRNPEYMPDMGPSRTYEAQGSTVDYRVEGINFDARPVVGTISRDAPLPNGLQESSAGQLRAQSMKNPLYPLKTSHQVEGKRLYTIHCEPCHGAKLDGNGPLYNGGDGPFVARPTNLLPLESRITDGTIFYTISFGKNMMGSFRDRLSEHERWLIVGYIRQLNNHQNN